MGKTIKPKMATRTGDQDEIAHLAAAASAKQQFVSSAMDMGWRLALSVLVPVIIGTWLDRRYHTTPSWTLVALFLAVGLAVMVVTKTIQNVNNQSNRKNK